MGAWNDGDLNSEKRVQSSTLRRKGIFVKLSSRDDLPELWSPTTTSYGQVSCEQKRGAREALPGGGGVRRSYVAEL
jgi:hypothetical protein